MLVVLAFALPLTCDVCCLVYDICWLVPCILTYAGSILLSDFLVLFDFGCFSDLILVLALCWSYSGCWLTGCFASDLGLVLWFTDLVMLLPWPVLISFCCVWLARYWYHWYQSLNWQGPNCNFMTWRGQFVNSLVLDNYSLLEGPTCNMWNFVYSMWARRFIFGPCCLGSAVMRLN